MAIALINSGFIKSKNPPASCRVLNPFSLNKVPFLKMNYNIDEKYCRIDIYGSAEGIRRWIKAIDDSYFRGSRLYELKDKLDNLENIAEFESVQFNFNKELRIYFSRDHILYLPNVSSSAKKFWFNIVKDSFNKAKELYLKDQPSPQD